MRSLAALLLFLPLAACGSEPDFDERYEQTEADIRASAAAIDEDMAERQAEAGQGEQTAAPSPSPPR